MFITTITNSVEIDIETIKRYCPLDSRENALDYITGKALEAARGDLSLYSKIWKVLWYQAIPLSLKYSEKSKPG